jgi:hypothetical protein
MKPQLVRGLFEPGLPGLALIIVGMVVSVAIHSRVPAGFVTALVVLWAVWLNHRRRAG